MRTNIDCAKLLSYQIEYNPLSEGLNHRAVRRFLLWNTRQCGDKKSHIEPGFGGNRQNVRKHFLNQTDKNADLVRDNLG